MNQKKFFPANITRRKFISNSTIIVAGACVCGIPGCATITGVGNTPEINPKAYEIVNDTTLRVDLSSTVHLSEVGGSEKILGTVENTLVDSIIIARTDKNNYVVAQLGCTHRGVELEYQHDDERFKCASLGGSQFYLDGTNDGGPAATNGPNPLRIYSSNLVDNMLTLTLSG